MGVSWDQDYRVHTTSAGFGLWRPDFGLRTARPWAVLNIKDSTGRRKVYGPTVVVHAVREVGTTCRRSAATRFGVPVWWHMGLGDEP